MTESNHLRAIAYNYSANGMVEHSHRQLKAPIKCDQNKQWIETLPTVILGIRINNENIKSSFRNDATEFDDVAHFIKDLRHKIQLTR